MKTFKEVLKEIENYSTKRIAVGAAEDSRVIAAAKRALDENLAEVIPWGKTRSSMCRCLNMRH